MKTIITVLVTYYDLGGQERREEFAFNDVQKAFNFQAATLNANNVIKVNVNVEMFHDSENKGEQNVEQSK
jgi:hypothetical protein